MKLAIVTAIFGDYDDLHELPEDHGFDEAICLTDNPNMRSKTWDIRLEQKSDNPRLLAKRPKMQPQRYVEADAWVWVDGQIQTKKGFSEFARSQIGEQVAAFQHPERACIYEEAEVVKSRNLARREVINHQMALYKKAGMPERFGLWECAVLVWPKSGLELGRLWLQEVRRQSLRDQLALPFLSWSRGIKVETLEGHSRSNPFTHWIRHRKGK